MSTEDEPKHQHKKDTVKPGNRSDLSEDDTDYEDDDDVPYVDEKEADEYEQLFEAAVKEVMGANISDSTKTSHRNNLVRLIKFIFQYQKRRNCEDKYKLIETSLLREMLKIETGKGYESKLTAVVKAAIDKAGPDYHPLAVDKLEVDVFMNHLLHLKKNKSVKPDKKSTVFAGRSKSNGEFQCFPSSVPISFPYSNPPPPPHLLSQPPCLCWKVINK